MWRRNRIETERRISNVEEERERTRFFSLRKWEKNAHTECATREEERQKHLIELEVDCVALFLSHQ